MFVHLFSDSNCLTFFKIVQQSAIRVCIGSSSFENKKRKGMDAVVGVAVSSSSRLVVMKV